MTASPMNYLWSDSAFMCCSNQTTYFIAYIVSHNKSPFCLHLDFHCLCICNKSWHNSYIFFPYHLYQYWNNWKQKVQYVYRNVKKNLNMSSILTNKGFKKIKPRHWISYGYWTIDITTIYVNGYEMSWNR